MSESESEISEEHSDDSEASSDFNPFGEGEDDTDSGDGKIRFLILCYNLILNIHIWV